MRCPTHHKFALNRAYFAKFTQEFFVRQFSLPWRSADKATCLFFWIQFSGNLKLWTMVIFDSVIVSPIHPANNLSTGGNARVLSHAIFHSLSLEAGMYLGIENSLFILVSGQWRASNKPSGVLGLLLLFLRVVNEGDNFRFNTHLAHFDLRLIRVFK